MAGKGVWIGGGALALLVIAGIAGKKEKGDSASTTAPRSTEVVAVQTAVPALAITAEALGKAYDENELTARDKFEGRPLLITGTVDRISSTLGEPTLSMETSHLFSAKFTDMAQLKTLKAGQKITMRCERIKEAMSILYPEGCALAK